MIEGASAPAPKVLTGWEWARGVLTAANNVQAEVNELMSQDEGKTPPAVEEPVRPEKVKSPKPPRFTPERIVPQETQLIPIAHILAGQDMQMRVALDEATLAEYVEWLGDLARQPNGLEAMPPVVVFSDGQHMRLTPTGPLERVYFLADGFHRFEGWKFLRGNVPETIQARVLVGGRREAILYAAGANATHGLRRTSADKRRAVETLLKDAEWGAWSDNEIAKRCNVSQPFVGKVRGELSLITVISEKPSPEGAQRTYTTKHGTVATMKTAKIGKPVTREHVLENALPKKLDELGWKLYSREGGEGVRAGYECRNEALQAATGWRQYAKEAIDRALEISEGKPPNWLSGTNEGQQPGPNEEAQEVAEEYADTWSAGAVGLEKDWTAEELDTYTEAVEGGRPWAPSEPETMIEAAVAMTPQEIFDQWLSKFSEGNQRRAAQQIKDFGVHADLWPQLVMVYKDQGVPYIPDKIREYGAAALARMGAQESTAETREKINQTETVAPAAQAMADAIGFAVDEHVRKVEAGEDLVTITIERRLAEVLQAAVSWRHLMLKEDRERLMEIIRVALKN